MYNKIDTLRAAYLMSLKLTTIQKKMMLLKKTTRKMLLSNQNLLHNTYYTYLIYRTRKGRT